MSSLQVHFQCTYLAESHKIIIGIKCQADFLNIVQLLQDNKGHKAAYILRLYFASDHKNITVVLEMRTQLPIFTSILYTYIPAY